VGCVPTADCEAGSFSLLSKRNLSVTQYEEVCFLGSELILAPFILSHQLVPPKLPLCECSLYWHCLWWVIFPVAGAPYTLFKSTESLGQVVNITASCMASPAYKSRLGNRLLWLRLLVVFPQLLQLNAGIVLQIGHDLFLLYSFQLIIFYLYYNSTLCSMSYKQHC
jgi:hypothetical protein